MAKMGKESRYSSLSTKQKSRTLVLMMLLPLLTVIAVANTFWALASAKIINYYVDSELKKNVEVLNSNVRERMDPIITNIDNFSNFATLAEDDVSIYKALVSTFYKNLEYANAFYYATVPTSSRKSLFIHSGGWVPPASFDVTTRSWFANAIKDSDEICFSDPYIDADTNSLTVTISKCVKGSNGKPKGVVACDIILEQLIGILRETEITKSTEIEIITKDGLYMTNDDPKKIMQENYFDQSNFSGDRAAWMDGNRNILVNSKNYYAICQISPSPWFITIEGKKIDFTGALYMTIFTFEAIQILYAVLLVLSNIRKIALMRKGEQRLGEVLFDESQKLVVATKETAATSQDQSAAVKEIVATMEDSNALSESISSKINGVSFAAQETSANVTTGVAKIEENVAQLHSIFDANQKTITEMKDLGEKIESIWDIVSLINNVADQAKIIAFNAELEASSAGEAGKSFRIVANEIRRLSDGIIDGTKEIKDKITEIQHSSDALIVATEDGTEKINAGYENAKNLGEMFENIKQSAENTSESANDITEIIQQQAMASEQILIALKQISAGVENFTVATDNISESSEHISAMSEELNKTIRESKKKK